MYKEILTGLPQNPKMNQYKIDSNRFIFWKTVP